MRDYLRGTYGALLVERAERRPELWGFVIMSVLGAVVFLATADPSLRRWTTSTASPMPSSTAATGSTRRRHGSTS